MPSFWDRNYHSFLNYTQQALYGIHGVITDACSGAPVQAKIFVNNHDINNSYMMTDPRVGYYVRPIKGGTYSITYSAEGYVSQTMSITIADRQKVVQNIVLVPEGTNAPVANFEADKTVILPNEMVLFTDKSEHATTWEWYFEGGTPQTSVEQNPTVLYENPGKFGVKLTVGNANCSNEKWIENYIHVKGSENDPVANFQADKTEILSNETVTFTNLSENADSYEWHFEGGTPETSNEQNPVVLYANKGTFTVKLTVTNETGSDEMIKENYIVVDELAVNDIENIKMIIFPNPVSQETSITIDTDLQITKIEWVNMSGAVVKAVYSNVKPYTFSVSGIEKGIYLMRMETEKGSYGTKVKVY
jgi:PKD repeat protein